MTTENDFENPISGNNQTELRMRPLFQYNVAHMYPRKQQTIRKTTYVVRSVTLSHPHMFFDVTW